LFPSADDTGILDKTESSGVTPQGTGVPLLSAFGNTIVSYENRIRYYLNTLIATSGHISAHRQHPVHCCSVPEKTAGVYPWLFICSLKIISFFGHAMAQSPQPLHLNSSISIFGIFSVPYGKCAVLRFDYDENYQKHSLQVKLFPFHVKHFYA